MHCKDDVAQKPDEPEQHTAAQLPNSGFFFKFSFAILFLLFVVVMKCSFIYDVLCNCEIMPKC